MITLDLMKSSEVRKAGDRSNCPTFKYTNNRHTAEILALYCGKLLFSKTFVAQYEVPTVDDMSHENRSHFGTKNVMVIHRKNSFPLFQFPNGDKMGLIFRYKGPLRFSQSYLGCHIWR